jgi:hypothetical protein
LSTRYGLLVRRDPNARFCRARGNRDNLAVSSFFAAAFRDSHVGCRVIRRENLRAGLFYRLTVELNLLCILGGPAHSDVLALLHAVTRDLQLNLRLCASHYAKQNGSSKDDRSYSRKLSLHYELLLCAIRIECEPLSFDSEDSILGAGEFI